MVRNEVNITEICDTISVTYNGDADEVVLINTSDVSEGACLNHERVPNKNLKGQFKKTFQKDDILFSEIRPANKRFAYIDFDPKDYIASTKLMVLRAKDNVNPRFLYQILRSDNTLIQLQTLAESRSGTFPQITYSELANVSYPLPPRQHQDRIVSILSSLDRKIELNNKINAQLEEMAQAIFKSWFVDFEPFKDGKFVESELGMIPEGWRECRAEEVYRINIGKTPPRKESQWFSNNPDDNIWVSIADMGTCGMFIANSSEYLTSEAITKHNVQMVEKNTVLLSFKLTVGRVAIADEKLTTNEAIARFSVPNDDHIEYLYLMLKNYDYNSLGSTSSIATAVNSKTIKGMKLLIPTNIILAHFSKKVKPIFERVRTLSRENSHLSQLRDTLLPKLMNGEIELPDDYLQHCLYYKGEEECPFPVGTHAAWYWRDEAMGQDENHRSIGHSFIEKGLQFIPLPAEQVQQLPSDIQDMLAYATACACNMQPMGGDEYLKHYGKSIEELNEIDMH